MSKLTARSNFDHSAVPRTPQFPAQDGGWKRLINGRMSAGVRGQRPPACSYPQPTDAFIIHTAVIPALGNCLGLKIIILKIDILCKF